MVYLRGLHNWDASKPDGGERDYATAILAKIDSMDREDATIAKDGERTPEATARRIANLVAAGDISGAVRTLQQGGGLLANKSVTDLIEMQKAEILRMRKDADARETELTAAHHALIAEGAARNAADAKVARLVAAGDELDTRMHNRMAVFNCNVSDDTKSLAWRAAKEDSK